jgi:acyloxyacyl hydrolase
MLIFELVGNDVCSGHNTTDSFTKPDEFKKNIMKYWSWLDTVLPKGSHILVLGLVDGRILYDTLKNETHPLGMSYPKFYDFLNCLGISPCWYFKTYFNIFFLKYIPNKK